MVYLYMTRLLIADPALLATLFDYQIGSFESNRLCVVQCMNV